MMQAIFLAALRLLADTFGKVYYRAYDRTKFYTATSSVTKATNKNSSATYNVEQQV